MPKTNYTRSTKTRIKGFVASIHVFWCMPTCKPFTRYSKIAIKNVYIDVYAHYKRGMCIIPFYIGIYTYTF
jgi:hypothetical protein